MKAIADHPPPEMYQPGVEIDCQCARCGSSVDSERCEMCEDGFVGLDGWDEDEIQVCESCDGRGVWHRCMSSPEWCDENPIPGREDVQRGKIEWYTTPIR